ncbi:MAG: transcriptional repressor [Microgenomates group bacterium]
MSDPSLKELIVLMLKEHHLLSASEFLTVLERAGKPYNKTSVYRALDQLLADEIICRHHFSQSEASYELREHHHAHMICTKCSCVQTSECTYNQPEKIGGFLVNHHHTTLFGVCENCRTV